MSVVDQDQSSTEASSRDSSRLKTIIKIAHELHGETFKKLAESEKKDLDFELAMAEEIWMKVKGIPIPKEYSVADRIGIFERYYHRAVAKSQGE